jgi:hypothetical protein
MEEAVDVRMRVSGDDHIETLTTKCLLLSLLTRTQPDEAEAYARKEVERARNVLSEKHKVTNSYIQYLSSLQPWTWKDFCLESWDRRPRTLWD